MKKLTLITLITLHATLLHAANSVKVQNLVPVTPPLSDADIFYIIKSASDHTATMGNVASYINLNIDAATGTIDYLIANGLQSGTAVIANASFTALSTTNNIVAGGQGRFAGLYATGKATLVDASVTAISGTNAIFSAILKGASIDATTGLKTPYLNAAKGNITAASFGGISTSGNAVIAGQGRFGTLYNAGASTFGGNMTLSGSAANIALGSNWVSADGGDEGLTISNSGNVSLSSGKGVFFDHTNKAFGQYYNATAQQFRMGTYSTIPMVFGYTNTIDIQSDFNAMVSVDYTSLLRLSGDNSYYGYIGGATTATNPNLRWQLGSYGEDFSYLIFDAYINPAVIAWKSSDVGSNAAIFKASNKLLFDYDTGVAPGNNLTWKQGGYMDATNGSWVFSPGGSAVLTIQSASYEVTGAVGNSAAIFDSVAIRSGVFQDGLKAPYKTEIKTLDGKSVDLKSTDEVPTIYRYKINPEWAEEKAEKEYQEKLVEYEEQKEKEEARVEKEYQEAVAKYEIEMNSYQAKVEIGEATGFIKPVEPQKQGIMLQTPVKRVEPVHEGWQEGFIREKLPERYHTPDGGINLSLIAQDSLARVAALEKRVEALEGRR